ncbi:hypothetical protein [Thalassotalea fusca]
MDKLESEILKWYIQHYPEYAESLEVLSKRCNIDEREYSDGYGAFITFDLSSENVFLDVPDEVAQIEGPLIKSPELEYGASVGLGLNEKGNVIYMEIWAHNYDYPLHRHVKEYIFETPSINYINLVE